MYEEIIPKITHYKFVSENELMLYNDDKYLLFKNYEEEEEKENEEQQEQGCGCDAKSTTTILNNEGKIIYRERTPDFDFDYYLNKYWIIVSQGNVMINYIICNEDIISEEIKELITQQRDVRVKFSGNNSQVCEGKVESASISYERIVLTKIEDVNNSN